jgi:hypothetical protein
MHSLRHFRHQQLNKQRRPRNRKLLRKHLVQLQEALLILENSLD